MTRSAASSGPHVHTWPSGAAASTRIGSPGSSTRWARKANGRAVTAPSDVASAVDVAKKAGRSNVLVGVFRNGRTTFLPLKAAG